MNGLIVITKQILIILCYIIMYTCSQQIHIRGLTNGYNSYKEDNNT